MTPLIVLLAVLCILAMLGAAFAVSWGSGMAAGRAVRWAMNAGQPKPESVDTQAAYCLSPAFEQELAARRAEQDRLEREIAGRKQLNAWVQAQNAKRAAARAQ